MTLLKRIELHALNGSLNVAFHDLDTNRGYSWSDLNAISSKIASQILSQPNTPKYVLICSRHNILFPASIIGAWKAGCVPIMIHDGMMSHEIQILMKGHQRQDYLILLDSVLFTAVQEKWKELQIQLIDEAPTSENIELKDVKLNDYAIGLLSSGTSSHPRLYFFSHEALYQAAQIESENEPEYKNSGIANLRPHWTSAGLNSLWPSLLLGSSNFLSEQLRKTPMYRFLFQMLSRESVTHVILSPTYLISILAEGDMLPLPRTVNLYFGGTSLPKTAIQNLLNAGFKTSMRYGMTEVAHIIAKYNYSTQSLLDYQKNNVGFGYPNFDLKIINDFLAIRSPGVASGYFEDGNWVDIPVHSWFITPDRAQMTPEILIEGRENKILFVNGFRFHAQQVEEVLMSDGQILDCRVALLEGVLTAFVLISRIDFRQKLEKNLKSLANEKLSAYKRPQQYLFLDKWPVSANGKIDFQKLYLMVESKTSDKK